MVNCNPETVSTDYDTSDRLYFEPLTLEDVLEVINVENPFGVIVQYGGQTPLSLAVDIERSGEPILGTGGIIPPPKGYWKEIQKVLRDNDILLIADEV